MSDRPASYRANAFSLVELLVVVAIISILAGLLLPVLSRAVTSARLVACISNQRQIYQLYVYYAGDYPDRLPAAMCTWFECVDANPTPVNLGTVYCYGYTENVEMLNCADNTYNNDKGVPYWKTRLEGIKSDYEDGTTTNIDCGVSYLTRAPDYNQPNMTVTGTVACWDWPHDLPKSKYDNYRISPKLTKNVAGQGVVGYALSFPRGLLSCLLPNGHTSGGKLKYDYVTHGRRGFNVLFADGTVFTKVADCPGIMETVGTRAAKFNVGDTAHPGYREPWAGYTGDYW